jgi:ABC-type nitrate/sulfonate/bicarbonate transport system substrate-binding protein
MYLAIITIIVNQQALKIKQINFQFCFLGLVFHIFRILAQRAGMFVKGAIRLIST